MEHISTHQTSLQRSFCANSSINSEGLISRFQGESKAQCQLLLLYFRTQGVPYISIQFSKFSNAISAYNIFDYSPLKKSDILFNCYKNDLKE